MSVRKKAAHNHLSNPQNTGVGRHRPRASVACNNCRSRKVKCDVQKIAPGEACTPCRTADVQCVVSHQDDRRRYGAKGQIAVLQGRLQSLEAMMKKTLDQNEVTSVTTEPSPPSSNHSSHNEDLRPVDHAEPPIPSLMNSRPPASSPQNEEPGPALYEPSTATSMEDSCRVFPQQSIGSAMEGAVNSNPQNTDQMMNDIAGLPKFPGMLNGEGTSGMGTGLLTQQQPLIGPTPLTPPADEQIPRLNVDISSGQLRFYGPTTQLHMESPHVETPAFEEEEDVDSEISVNLDSSQLRKSLLSSCWRYYAIQASVVDEQNFLAHRQNGMRSQYYSLFLEYALLACGSRVSTSVAVRKLGKEYADRAKKEIPLELEYPTLASLQAFLLLSDFEATRGRDRLGWTYTGIACRLILDFGMHEDCGQMVEKGHISPSEARLRNSIFLSAFVYDTLWSLYLGRPRAISLPNLGLTQGSTHSPQDPVQNAWVALCLHIAEATDMLNASSSLLTGNTIEHLQRLDDRIRGIYEALPPEMTYHSSSVAELDAAAYGWHMQFCGIRIVIHRSLTRAYLHQEGQEGQWNSPELNNADRSRPDNSYNMEASRAIIYDCAVRVTQLMLAYRQLFGFEKIITVMLDNMYVAAVALINHILVLKQRGIPVENEPRRIRLLADTLEQVQKHFPIAFRMRSTLSRLLAGTPWASLLGPMPAQNVQMGHILRPNIIAPPVNSWGTVEALIGSCMPEASMPWSGLFDERDQPWFPDPSQHMEQ